MKYTLLSPPLLKQIFFLKGVYKNVAKIDFLSVRSSMPQITCAVSLVPSSAVFLEQWWQTLGTALGSRENCSNDGRLGLAKLNERPNICHAVQAHGIWRDVHFWACKCNRLVVQGYLYMWNVLASAESGTYIPRAILVTPQLKCWICLSLNTAPHKLHLYNHGSQKFTLVLVICYSLQ